MSYMKYPTLYKWYHDLCYVKQIYMYAVIYEFITLPFTHVSYKYYIIPYSNKVVKCKRQLPAMM